VVSVVNPREHREAADAIAAGHADYPSFRHLFPDPRRCARALRSFFGATGRDAVPFGSLLTARVGDRAQATAVWLRPGAFPWTWWRKVRAAPAFASVDASSGGGSVVARADCQRSTVTPLIPSCGAFCVVVVRSPSSG
jgi:hypothetical protein